MSIADQELPSTEAYVVNDENGCHVMFVAPATSRSIGPTNIKLLNSLESKLPPHVSSTTSRSGVGPRRRSDPNIPGLTKSDFLGFSKNLEEKENQDANGANTPPKTRNGERSTRQQNRRRRDISRGPGRVRSNSLGPGCLVRSYSQGSLQKHERSPEQESAPVPESGDPGCLSSTNGTLNTRRTKPVKSQERPKCLKRSGSEGTLRIRGDKLKSRRKQGARGVGPHSLQKSSSASSLRIEKLKKRTERPVNGRSSRSQRVRSDSPLQEQNKVSNKYKSGASATDLLPTRSRSDGKQRVSPRSRTMDSTRATSAPAFQRSGTTGSIPLRRHREKSERTGSIGKHDTDKDGSAACPAKTGALPAFRCCGTTGSTQVRRYRIDASESPWLKRVNSDPSLLVKTRTKRERLGRKGRTEVGNEDGLEGVTTTSKSPQLKRVNSDPSLLVKTRTKRERLGRKGRTEVGNEDGLESVTATSQSLPLKRVNSDPSLLASTRTKGDRLGRKGKEEAGNKDGLEGVTATSKSLPLKRANSDPSLLASTRTKGDRLGRKDKEEVGNEDGLEGVTTTSKSPPLKRVNSDPSLLANTRTKGDRLGRKGKEEVGNEDSLERARPSSQRHGRKTSDQRSDNSPRARRSMENSGARRSTHGSSDSDGSEATASTGSNHSISLPRLDSEQDKRTTKHSKCSTEVKKKETSKTESARSGSGDRDRASHSGDRDRTSRSTHRDRDSRSSERDRASRASHRDRDSRSSHRGRESRSSRRDRLKDVREQRSEFEQSLNLEAAMLEEEACAEWNNMIDSWVSEGGD